VACGMAVLRGANIFTAGILAMSPGKLKIVNICKYFRILKLATN